MIARPEGLYCPPGNFYIDPWRPVADALITHAHGDHLRAGSGSYVVATSGVALAKLRLPADSAVTEVAYAEQFQKGPVSVSLHPAGHVLGSSQVRLEHAGRVWVVSGDYKRALDPTCAPFEPLTCDVFISEATFALPAYRWPATQEVMREIYEWWQANRRRGVASVLFAYSLGKAQRVLAELCQFTQDSVYVHGAVAPLVEAYRGCGIVMLPTQPIVEKGPAAFAGHLILAPPSAAGSPWMRRFGECSTGFCSGWMRVRGNRRRRGYDRGFVLSDHADWPALLDTVGETGARRVLLTHGHSEFLSRYLSERGQKAAALSTEFGAEE